MTSRTSRLSHNFSASRFLPPLVFSALTSCVILASASSCSGPPQLEGPRTTEGSPAQELRFAGERHFGALTQLTFGGENAEAYFSADGAEIIFQSTREGFQCDQIFRMDADGKNQRLVSTGTGRTTCSYIFPDQPKILYSSSHATLTTCPPKPDSSRGYVWPLLPDFEIYVAGAEGENPTALAPHEGYDAEAVLSPRGDGIVFTSTRSGDIDIWFMNTDGSGLKQLTSEVGYDGGAFFSLDGREVVYRANHPTEPKALEDYKELLANDLVRPSVMDLRIMNRDGSNKRTILANGAANFAPYFHPDGQHIIFASNLDDPGGRNFDLYMIEKDGTHLERITFNPSFDAFPMFSHDGKKLIFASNRHGSEEGETNVFVADWLNEPSPGVESTLDSDAFNAASWLTFASRLSAPEFKGRGLGTAELKRAGEVIAAEFASAGLEPGGDGETYYQVFGAATSKSIQSASLAIGGTVAELDSEFQPFPFSSSADVNAGAVFVGYGITSGPYLYDDYAGIDVSGKVAVAFRFEPERASETSRFDGTKPTRDSDLRFKGINARHHGAVALIIVNPPPVNGEKDTMYAFDGAPSDVGIPVLHLTWKAAAKLFDEKVLRDGYDKIESSGNPASVALSENVESKIQIDAVTAEVSNVVGRLRGKDSKRAIVIGAHYDHLGIGGEGSLADDLNKAHLGADDNASGVAMVVELAKTLSQLSLETDVYVVAFTGEESGLLGSHWFVEHPPVDLTNVEAMFNFDMVGRLRDQRLTVLGTGTAKGLVEVVRRAQVGLPIDLETSADGFGPSDQMAFYAQRVPVLHFFTGSHEDYHRPSDSADKLNPTGAATVGTMALRAIHELATAPASKPYIAVKSDLAGDAGGDGRRGYGPYFGSVPAFGGEAEKGVKVASSRPDSPADKAGLQKDDVIVKFGVHDITTLKDYAFALRQHKAGEAVKVVVIRDGKEVTLDAVLGEKDRKPSGKSPHGHKESPHGNGPHPTAESQPAPSPH